MLRRRDEAVECLLVQPPGGSWGFPKGKRNRGESVLANALRELFEETGLTPAQITLHAGIEVDERSDKGNLAVRYLAATLADEGAALTLARGEIAEARWWPVAEALAALKRQRRAVLAAVVAALSE